MSDLGTQPFYFHATKKIRFLIKCCIVYIEFENYSQVFFYFFYFHGTKKFVFLIKYIVHIGSENYSYVFFLYFYFHATKNIRFLIKFYTVYIGPRNYSQVFFLHISMQKENIAEICQVIFLGVYVQYSVTKYVRNGKYVQTCPRY